MTSPVPQTYTETVRLIASQLISDSPENVAQISTRPLLMQGLWEGPQKLARDLTQELETGAVSWAAYSVDHVGILMAVLGADPRGFVIAYYGCRRNPDKLAYLIIRPDRLQWHSPLDEKTRIAEGNEESVIAAYRDYESTVAFQLQSAVRSPDYATLLTEEQRTTVWELTNRLWQLNNSNLPEIKKALLFGDIYLRFTALTAPLEEPAIRLFM